MTWNEVNPDELGFEIYRAATLAGTTGPNVTVFDDTNAPPGTAYLYKVRAISACGPGPFSNTDYGRRRPVPDPVTDCTASSDLCACVRVSWNHPDTDEDGFKIVRDGELVAMAGPGASSYDDSTAVVGQPYSYIVVATNTCGVVGLNGFVDRVSGAG